MSPFVLLQLVGPAVALHVAETTHGHFPARYGVSENLRRLVEAGKPGIWSWDERGKPYLDDETRALFVQGDKASTGEEVRARALEAMAQEVRLMLDEGVVAAYLDRAGVSERAGGRRFLEPGVASIPGT